MPRCIANLLSAMTAPLGAPTGGAEVDSVSQPASLPLFVFLTHCSSADKLVSCILWHFNFYLFIFLLYALVFFYGCLELELQTVAVVSCLCGC